MTEQPTDPTVEDVTTEAVNDDPQAAQPGAAADEQETPTEGTAADEVADAGVGQVTPETDLAAERLADLQRLQAEYVNYKRRVDRDRVEVKQSAVVEVLTGLLPVLDEIHLAREHGDVADGPFKAITDKLEAALGKYGLVPFGAVGEPFDPTQHEALMHAEWNPDDENLPSDATTTTVVTVFQPGFKAGDRVLRAARVAVADPT